MSRSIISRLSKIQNRLVELSSQYKELHNPASIHFNEVADQVQAIVENPKLVDEGSQLNLSRLLEQCEQVVQKYGSRVISFKYSLRSGHKGYAPLDVEITRLFEAETGYGDRRTQSFYSLTIENVVSEIEEWLQKHVKVAEERGIEWARPPVVVDKEKEVPNG